MASSRGPAPHPRTSLRIALAMILVTLGVSGAEAQTFDGADDDEDLVPLDAPPSPPAPTPTAPRAVLPLRLSFLRRRTLSEGTGRLEGHVDARLEAVTFEIAGAAVDDEVPVTHEVTWRRQGPQVCESGREEGRVEGPLWISPDAAAGSTVEILGERRVVSRELTLDVGNVAIPALLAEAHGERTRDDALGRFHVLYSDEVWLDGRTGLLLRRERTEIGEADDASYEEHDVLWLTDAPFLPGGARSPTLGPAACAEPLRAPSPWARLGIPFGLLVLAGLGLAGLRRRLAAKERIQP